MDDRTLQVEALKSMQQWSIWLITIATALLGVVGPNLPVNAWTRIAMVLLLATIAVAVMLVGAIPALMQRVGKRLGPTTKLLGFERPGIYALNYIGIVPLWVMSSLQRVLFLGALLCGYLGLLDGI